jgi:hypothetical protein
MTKRILTVGLVISGVLIWRFALQAIDDLNGLMDGWV